ncbi:MAG: TerD family protein [Bacillota bacterium]|nr:TerD family protein [Bacillota bacterium]
MSVKVTKGERVNLSTANGKINTIIIEAGWEVNNTAGYDIDLETFLLDEKGKAPNESSIVFYNNPSALEGRIMYMGIVQSSNADTTKGQIKIDLSSIPDSISKIDLTLTIYEGAQKRQSFKNISKLYITISDYNTKKEILKYQIDEAYSVETALVLAQIYRYKGSWKFNAVGSGFKGGLEALCKNYGIDTEEQSVIPSSQINTQPLVQYSSNVSNKQQSQEGTKLYYSEGGLWYEGSLKNGLFNGKGRLYRRDGSLSYDAEFKDGKLNGFGRNILSNGSIKFEGYFNDDKPIKGKYFEKGKLVYEGDF